MHSRLVLFPTLVLHLLLSGQVSAQWPDNPLGRNMQFPKIRSTALAGNLVGDPSVRGMVVLLPPSYFRDRRTRFPVVYLLHGLGKRTQGEMESTWLMVRLYEEMKEGKLGEMILVAVDGTTIFGGSYYANSPTIGDFETYVTGEIVSHIDSSYRTEAGRKGRAIAGFSMGGHGALKLAMKHSDVFSMAGSLSGSPLSIRFRKPIYKKALAGHRKPASLDQLVKTITFENNWSLAAAYAKAAAFSPNPRKPPLYLNLPFERDETDERDPVWREWWENDPLTMVARYHDNLELFDELYLDHGEDETTLGTEDFLRELIRYDITFTNVVFRGDHTDQLYIRYLRMLRSFAAQWSL
jgi:S-formylglutathione hydrolase FrmB